MKGGTRRNYEHEDVIRNIESMQFHEDEIQPHVQHLKQFFRYSEEEMNVT